MGTRWRSGLRAGRLRCAVWIVCCAALALAGTLNPAADAAASGTGTSQAAPALRPTLVTDWGPAFWRAVTQHPSPPPLFTPGGDAYVLLPGAFTPNGQLWEFAPNGRALWSLPSRTVETMVSLDRGRYVAFLSRPVSDVNLTSAPDELLTVMNTETHRSASASLDGNDVFELEAAGHFAVVSAWNGGPGGWYQFTAVYNTRAQFLEEIGNAALVPNGAGAWIVGGCAHTGQGATLSRLGPTARITRVRGAIMNACGDRFYGLSGGRVLALSPSGPAAYESASLLEVTGGTLRQLWSVSVGKGSFSAPAISGSHVELAGPSGIVLLIAAARPAVLQIPAPRTASVVPVAATPAGAAYEVVPNSGGARIPPSLVTVGWSGGAMLRVPLPADASGPWSAWSATTQVSGFKVTVTDLAPDVGMVSAASAPRAAGPGESLPTPSPQVLAEAAPDLAGLAQPTVAPQTEVVAEGHVITPGNPLTVSQSEAGEPIPILVEGAGPDGTLATYSVPDEVRLSDQGAGGSFLNGFGQPVTAQNPAAFGAGGEIPLRYVNPRAGSYVLTASLQATPAPPVTVPSAVLAGQPFSVRVDVPPADSSDGGQGVKVTVRPLYGSDVADIRPRTAALAPGAAQASVGFTAGSHTGSADFLAWITRNASSTDFHTSMPVTVGDIAPPDVVQTAAGLEVAPAAQGDTPIGFEVAGGPGGPVWLPYLGDPVTVPRPGRKAAGGLQVLSVSADGVLSKPQGAP